jgi:hypothetical protein
MKRLQKKNTKSVHKKLIKYKYTIQNKKTMKTKQIGILDFSNSKTH